MAKERKLSYLTRLMVQGTISLLSVLSINVDQRLTKNLKYLLSSFPPSRNPCEIGGPGL